MDAAPSHPDKEAKMCKTIFLKSGRTFTFKNVKDIVENETTLTFAYKSGFLYGQPGGDPTPDPAMSDGRVKRVKFYIAAIAGHSLYDEVSG